MKRGASLRVCLIVVLAAFWTAGSAPEMKAATARAGESGDSQAAAATRDLWQSVSANASSLRALSAHEAAVRPAAGRALRLNHQGMRAVLSRAPVERTDEAKARPLVLDLPGPDGQFQRFVLTDSPVMEDGLAAKHPEIKTYRGHGVTDPTATIRADMTPLGFHASVRSTKGAWYIDPYYHLDTSLYVSYFGRDLKENPHGAFTEAELTSAEISADHAYYHAADPVTLHGVAFADNSLVTITITDPRGGSRTVKAAADGLGGFDVVFEASPGEALGVHSVEATDGSATAAVSYEVVSGEDLSKDPPTGDVLRTYRLALITDPGYSDFFGGPANVTAAKVTLMNRVVQIYEDDLSIHMNLVANNDLLNLNTWAQAIGPNGPCGAAGCFTQSQVTGCSSTTRARFVIGQIIGASNYDVGHLGLGQPGGGVANLGVVGRSNKAGGCTGIPTPVGDFYAVDYVAHEMGHQFSGNHPFNGNQLNCSGGNRNASTSVEPGSGSSVMAYAGICLTDDLQPHSDPYFCQRSQQEMSTYTSGNQNPINEVQTASLRHFGGGNEVQTVTFGPGFAPSSTVQPLSLTINAAPGAASRGGAEEEGNTVTIATANSHTLQPGDSVTIAGVANASYNGTFTVTAIPSSRSFQYTNPVSGLPTSGGGTVTLAVPGATESGNTVTISTSTAHGRSVGDMITIAGVGVAAYNGTFPITAVPTPRSFQYTDATAGLANSGGGTATFFTPFQVQIGGNNSAVINGSNYSNAGIATAINGIAGFAGTVTVTGAATTGFTVTYGGASAGLDVASIQLVNLSCGGCFASVEETNHGGSNDSFVISFGGADTGAITNGGNYTAAGIAAAINALPSVAGVGGSVTVAGFGGGTFNNTGFQVTFGGGVFTNTNIASNFSLKTFSAGASGFVGETDKGGAVDNKGGTITPTGDSIPVVTAPAQFTIPLRTPFVLTGSATDGDGDTLLYSWEQNDRGAAAGTSLLSNTKTNGPLFAMFSVSAPISPTDTLQYNSPNENHLTTDPSRTFPSLAKIIANNTNADTGQCPSIQIAPPVPIPVRECFLEFLPTADYVGFAGVNASPLSLHFRLTARDQKGGTSSADTTLLLATGAGPFRVTSPDSGGSVPSGSSLPVTWNVANTDIAPVSTSNVKISLSTDGGFTYPYTLAASTANDGSEAVTLPAVVTTQARVKVEAVGNIFFDISNSDFSITGLSGPVTGKIWLGLKNSDDVGTNFDVLAEVLRNGSVFGTGEIDNVPGGSSGFNNAVLRAIDIALANEVPIVSGDSLAVRISIRIGATGHRSGTARLWYNDTQANSRLEFTLYGTPTTLYLRDGFTLQSTAAPVTSTSKKTIDVTADRAVGGNPWKVVGTWSKTY